MGAKTKEQRKQLTKLRLEAGDMLAFYCKECTIMENNIVCRETCPIGERLFQIGQELGVAPKKMRRTANEKIKLIKQYREMRESGMSNNTAVNKLKISRETIRLWEKQWEAGKLEESSGDSKSNQKAHVF